MRPTFFLLVALLAACSPAPDFPTDEEIMPILTRKVFIAYFANGGALKQTQILSKNCAAVDKTVICAIKVHADGLREHLISENAGIKNIHKPWSVDAEFRLTLVKGQQGWIEASPFSF